MLKYAIKLLFVLLGAAFLLMIACDAANLICHRRADGSYAELW